MRARTRPALILAAVALAGLPGSTTTSSPPSEFYAYIGALRADGYLYTQQPVRPGGRALSVTFTNSQAGVGRLVTNATSGQSITLAIPVGSFNTPPNRAGGGIAFQPVGAGTTTVLAGGSGLTATPQSSVTVAVNASLTAARAGAR